MYVTSLWTSLLFRDKPLALFRSQTRSHMINALTCLIEGSASTVLNIYSQLSPIYHKSKSSISIFTLYVSRGQISSSVNEDRSSIKVHPEKCKCLFLFSLVAVLLKRMTTFHTRLWTDIRNSEETSWILLMPMVLENQKKSLETG